MTDPVLVQVDDGLMVITINRPEVRNAIDGAVSYGVCAAVDELDARSDLRVGILTGAGGTFVPEWISRRSCAARALGSSTAG